MFGTLFSLVVRYLFAVPTQVAAARRALAGLEGTLVSVSPELDLVTAARARGRDLLSDQISPGQVRAALDDQLVALLPLLQRLPRRIGSITDQLDRGRLGFSVRLLVDPGDGQFLLGLVQQLTLTVLAATAAVGGVVMLVGSNGPQMLSRWPGFTWFDFAGLVLLFFGFVLAARALAFIFTGSQPMVGPDPPAQRAGPEGGRRLR